MNDVISELLTILCWVENWYFSKGCNVGSYHLQFDSLKHPHVAGCFGQHRSTCPPCIQFNQIGFDLV